MQRLEQQLDALARAGQTVTYGALARDLGLRIGALTAALEELMAKDVAMGWPLRAVLCEARLGNGLPALGFFQCAEQLGRDTSDVTLLVRLERDAVFEHASRGAAPDPGVFGKQQYG